jgi:hypothetical protein
LVGTKWSVYNYHDAYFDSENSDDADVNNNEVGDVIPSLELISSSFMENTKDNINDPQKVMR